MSIGSTEVSSPYIVVGGHNNRTRITVFSIRKKLKSMLALFARFGKRRPII